MTQTDLAERLIELAERCEKATGPDRTLDGLIDGLFNNRPKNGDYDADENCVWRKCDGFSGLCVRSDGFARKSFCARDYTTSLDAAMTLVPNGWDYCLSKGCDEPANVGMSPAGKVAEVHGNAATPALALCAAALRARSTQETNNGK